MSGQDARMLLNQAEIVEAVEKALRDWGARLKGKRAYTDPRTGHALFRPAADTSDPGRYTTKEDRQATRELFALIAQNGKLLRRLLNDHGCHEHIRPKMQGMLDLASGISSGQDMGGWWSRADEYAGEHLWGGPCSVADELHNWAVRLRAEAAAAPQAVGKEPGLREPAPRAIQCYRLHIAGHSQTLIAEMIKMDQGSVSRYVKQVRKYVTSGNVLPNLEPKGGKATSHPVDPRKLDYQEKPDGKVRPHKSVQQYDPDDK